MRFWLCYIISLGAFAFGVYLSGVDTILVFIDIPTFIFVPLLPLVLQSILSGSMGKVLKAVSGKNTGEEEARKALSWVQGFNRLVWCGGGLFFLMRAVFNLREFDSNALLMAFSIALLSPIYALLTSLSFTLPVMIILKNKLGER
jgi:hypothetical protein